MHRTITDETATALKKIDQKRELLNAIHKLDIAENYEALTDPIGKYIVNNREKIINEERTRRAQNNSKYNDEQNQRNQSLSNSPVSNQNNQIDQILDKEMYNDPENLESRQTERGRQEQRTRHHGRHARHQGRTTR